MLVGNALALVAGPPAKQIRLRSLRKQFLHRIYLTEASEGPGAARGAPGGPPRPPLDKFHTGTAYVAIGLPFFLAGAAWRRQASPGAGRSLEHVSGAHVLLLRSLAIVTVSQC